jgi:preprotein translocase subunit SecE
MSRSDSIPVHGGHGAGDVARERAGRSAGSGFFNQYKPDQGMWTRRGTFIGVGILIAWGAWFVRDQLGVYEDVAGIWGVLITTGVPILFAVVLGAAAWRVSFVNRKSGDFMIATEGEMKKVSWSTRKEVTGSTIVVITFTVLLAIFLAGVDVVFQYCFRSIGVLRV